MVTDEDILNKLEKDIETIEDQIENTEKYNKKNKTFMKYIKIAKALDYIMPYALSAAILFVPYKNSNKTPFIVDTVSQKRYIALINTSQGNYFQKTMESNDALSSIEYSTGWQINEYGIYERFSTTYIIDDNIDLNDIDSILKMDKEEIDNNFFYLDFQIIMEADEENLDPIYNDNVVVITRVIKTNSVYEENETFASNVLCSLSYLAIAFALGRGFQKIKKIIFQDYVKNNLEKYSLNFKEIDETRIERLKQILEIKEENLSLLSEEVNNGKIKTR